ncbi:MAG: PilZ domain-containing protein [Spirochaetaceae bacterium]
MKVLLVSDRNDERLALEKHFASRGTEIIHYVHPIKAMDNLDEIAPEVVIFNASDFPRHWKPFLVFLRDIRGRESAVFVLLRDGEFPVEEASKAEHLEVNAILSANLWEERTMEQLGTIISRYHAFRETRQATRFIPGTSDKIEFLFTNPYTLRLVRGQVHDISITGLRFVPADPAELQNLESGAQLNSASLRLGEEIVAVQAQIVRVTNNVGVQFLKPTPEVEGTIANYLGSRSKRDLEVTVQKEHA